MGNDGVRHSLFTSGLFPCSVQPCFPFRFLPCKWLVMRSQTCECLINEVKHCFSSDPRTFTLVTLAGSREQQGEQAFKGKLLFIPLNFPKGLDRLQDVDWEAWINYFRKLFIWKLFNIVIVFLQKQFLSDWQLLSIHSEVLFEYEVAQGSKVSLSLSAWCLCRREDVKKVLFIQFSKFYWKILHLFFKSFYFILICIIFWWQWWMYCLYFFNCIYNINK